MANNARSNAVHPINISLASFPQLRLMPCKTGAESTIAVSPEAYRAYASTVLDGKMQEMSEKYGMRVEELAYRRFFMLAQTLAEIPIEAFVFDKNVRELFGIWNSQTLASICMYIIRPIATEIGDRQIKAMNSFDELKKLTSALNPHWSDKFHHLVSRVMDHDFGLHLFVCQLASSMNYRNSFRNPYKTNELLPSPISLDMPFLEQMKPQLRQTYSHLSDKIIDQLQPKHVEALRILYDKAVTFRRVASGQSANHGTDFVASVNLQQIMKQLKDNWKGLFANLPLTEEDIEILHAVLQHEPRKQWVYVYEAKT